MLSLYFALTPMTVVDKKENNIVKDLDSKSKHKQYILDEKTPDKILKEIKELFKENDIITFVAFKDKIGLAFKIKRAS